MTVNLAIEGFKNNEIEFTVIKIYLVFIELF